jgi:hypothetical protein
MLQLAISDWVLVVYDGINVQDKAHNLKTAGRSSKKM